MAQALVILPVCGEGSILVVVVTIVSLSSALLLPPPPTLPRQHRHHTPSDERWGKGHAHGSGLPTRLDDGEGHFLSGAEKKAKYQVLVVSVMHDFYMLLHPRQKSANAVTRASVAPV